MAEDGPKKAAAASGEAEAEKGKDGGKDAAPGSPWPKLLESAGEKLLTLVISAGSLVGFVAFAGSVVLWSRFFAIHVPPDQVVAAVPRTESVAVGSVMLLLFGFFGALAALAVYLIDRGGRATPGMSRAILVILTVEAAVAIWIAGDSSVQAKVISSEVLIITFAAALWVTYVGKLIKLDTGLPNLKDHERPQKLEETPFWKEGNETDVTVLGVVAVLAAAAFVGGVTFAAMRVFGASVNWRWIIALGAGGLVPVIVVGIYCLRFSLTKARKRKADKEREDREEKRRKQEEERAKRERQRRAKTLIGRVELAWQACWRSRCRGCSCHPCVCHAKPGAKDPAHDEGEGKGKPPRFELSFLGAAVIVLLAAIAVTAPSIVIGEWWLGASLAIVFMIGSGLWRIAWLSKEQFIWLGLAVFISVPLFGALMLMVRNLAEPQVQALALIRSTDGPDEAIQGLYVTEANDRVYFANVATEGCSDKVKPASGRLLWVPRDEVVAMSVGPLENVEDAGKTALEMAYALTPAVETPAGDHVSLTPTERRSGKAGTTAAGDAAAGPPAQGKTTGKAEEKKTTPPKEKTKSQVTLVTQPEGRLEDPGPAVRPNFGTGLRLDPETASPEQAVTLSMSNPNHNPNVEGFGSARAGHNLRLGGVIADIAKEKAGGAAGAEYIEVGEVPGGAEERLLHLSKEGAFVFEEGEYKTLEDAHSVTGQDRYVKLEDPALRIVEGVPVSEEPSLYIRVDESGERPKVAEDAPTVVLAGGEFEGKPQEEETIDLGGLPLYRQAWHENRIKFRVPENAKSGVVTVECGQLAGAPLLRVSHTPTARISVRMQANSQVVTLNSARSSDEDGEKISARWTVEGVHRGRRPKITTKLPLRPGAYSVKLTVADEAGHVDTAILRMLRLPDSMFAFGKSEPDKHSEEAIEAARRSLANAVAATTPVAIELDGHADNPGATSFNLGLSLKRTDAVRDELMPQREEAADGELSLPVEELAYGESCPLEPGPGRQPRNRRVEVFVLDEGVTIKPAEGCTPGRLKHTSWHVPG